MEPWRQWLIGTGWDGLQILQTNPLSGQPITPQEQQWLNNWIAAGLTNKDGSPKPGYPLVELIEKMRNHPHQYWDKKIKDIGSLYTTGFNKRLQAICLEYRNYSYIRFI